MKALTMLTGEFISVSETIVNKDTGLLKLALVQKAKSRQEVTNQKMGAVDAQIKENDRKTKDQKEQYEVFERQVFQWQLGQTTMIATKTEQLVKEIDDELEMITKDTDSVRDQMSSMKPHTKE